MTERQVYTLAGVAAGIVAAGLLLQWWRKGHLTAPELQRLAFQRWRVQDWAPEEH